MRKNLLVAAVAASVCIASIVGCSGDDEASPAANAAPTPTVGPPPPPPNANDEAGAVPQLNLPIDAGPDAEPADAGPDVQPVDADPGSTAGARVFGVDEDGRLVSFRVNATAMVSVQNVTGLQPGEKLLAIDFRPANGMLYGLGSSSRLYTVDRATAAATVVGDGAAFTPPLAGQAHGFDVNPVADKIRVHTDVDQNLRLDPLTGKVTAVDGPLAFATADTNAGQSPNIVATAYSNNVSPAPTTTMLYALDSTRNLFVRLPNPNDGMIETVGAIGVDIEQAGGFDMTGANVPYAVLRVGSETALYTFDVATGVATKMGVVGHPVGITGIAVEP